MAELRPLVQKAMEYQRRLGLTDERFAREVLGITPGYWSKLRSGQAKGRGGTFIQSMYTRFPDLAFSLPSNFPIESAMQKAEEGGEQAAEPVALNA